MVNGPGHGAGGGISRRQFIGGLFLAGTGALLAACGGTATPTTVPTTAPATAPITATTSAITSTPGAAGATATPALGTATATTAAVLSATGTATTSTGTAIRAATPGGATRTPSTAAVGGDLGRMLALVPQKNPLPGAEGITFADVIRQKRNYGLEGATSEAAFRALGVSTAKLGNVVGALPLPQEAGLDHALNPLWRDTLAYDFWQVERTISTGSPPNIWTRLEGHFDRAAIAAALAKAGHQPVTYRDATILARGEDAAIGSTSEPITRLTLSRLNRVVLEDGALTTSPFTALAEAGIDARAGRIPSFAADPDYAALASALGPVVGARLMQPDDFFQQAAQNPRATPAVATAVATRLAQPDRPKLHPYRLVGLGLRDDGTIHTMVIALLYASAGDARADAPILRQRAQDYRLVGNGQLLRQRAVAGEPEIVAAGLGATVVLPLAITDEVNLGLWQQMLFRRDYGFLAE